MGGGVGLRGGVRVDVIEELKFLYTGELVINDVCSKFQPEDQLSCKRSPDILA